MRRILIVGAGMGGLSAALRLAQQGFDVQVIEARGGAGGLAGPMTVEGFTFDPGASLLLDYPGLRWMAGQLQLDLADFKLRRIEELFEVVLDQGCTIRFHQSLDRTAAEFERVNRGAGEKYRRFVEQLVRIYRSVQPMQWSSRPGLGRMIQTGAWRALPFLLKSLETVLRETRLPPELREVLGIWTHVAGQRVNEAPSPMAFVWALVHEFGAWYPVEGIGRIPELLRQKALEAGVQFSFNTRCERILCRNGEAKGIRTASGDELTADAVLINASALGAYLDLIPEISEQVKRRLAHLPLQSPGLALYLAVKGKGAPPYLRIRYGARGCRLLVQSSVASLELEREGWFPARLHVPLRPGSAGLPSLAAEQDLLAEILAEKEWKEPLAEYRILQTRTPSQWGRDYFLYKNSMNPVMTAAFMRKGRIAHRSPWVRRLYLAGSSTHPGQWISFCAISGILAADCLREDLDSD